MLRLWKGERGNLRGSRPRPSQGEVAKMARRKRRQSSGITRAGSNPASPTEAGQADALPGNCKNVSKGFRTAPP